MAHTHKDTIDLAVKTAILRAYPIGSYYLTEGNEDPKDFIGGGSRSVSCRRTRPFTLGSARLRACAGGAC